MPRTSQAVARKPRRLVRPPAPAAPTHTIVASVAPPAPVPLPQLLTVDAGAAETGLKPSALRDLIWHSRPRYNSAGDVIAANGFARVIVHIGGRVYLDRAALADYLNARRGLRVDGEVAA